MSIRKIGAIFLFETLSQELSMVSPEFDAGILCQNISINLIVTTDINQQHFIFAQKLKYYAALICNAKGPEAFEFSSQLVSSQTRTKGVL